MKVQRCLTCHVNRRRFYWLILLLVMKVQRCLSHPVNRRRCWCWLTAYSDKGPALSGSSSQHKVVLSADFAYSDQGLTLSGSSGQQKKVAVFFNDWRTSFYLSFFSEESIAIMITHVDLWLLSLLLFVCIAMSRRGKQVYSVSHVFCSFSLWSFDFSMQTPSVAKAHVCDWPLTHRPAQLLGLP